MDGVSPCRRGTMLMLYIGRPRSVTPHLCCPRQSFLASYCFPFQVAVTTPHLLVHRHGSISTYFVRFGDTCTCAATMLLRSWGRKPRAIGARALSCFRTVELVASRGCVSFWRQLLEPLHWELVSLWVARHLLSGRAGPGQVLVQQQSVSRVESPR